MSEFANCMYKLRAEGKPYPRTCAECGLFGPCKAGLRPEREAAAASARPLPLRMLTAEERQEIVNIRMADYEGTEHIAVMLQRKFCEVNGLGIVPLAPQDTGEKE